MECSLTYQLLGHDGREQEIKEASAVIDEVNLSISPFMGDAFLIPHRDIIELSAGDYAIQISLASDDKVVLSRLGYHYDGFFRELVKKRNEVILQDLLMYEALRKGGFSAETVYIDEQGKETQLQKCELRLYETALVILPENGELVRITYSEMQEVMSADYRLVLTTEFAEQYVFSKMGRQFEMFNRTLSDVINELSLKAQNTLKEILPGLNPSEIRAISRMMKEGKAVPRDDLEAVSPELWRQLESKLAEVGIKEEYDYLQSLAQHDKVCIGMKRGLMGDLTGEYVWFLIPIYSCDPAQPGNAVAMEAGSLEGGGRATYFFRITDRGSYGDFKDIESLHGLAQRFLKQVNRCMLQINFRREPIYLSDDKMKEDGYEKYRYAVQKLPALQKLRYHFIGRVLHYSSEQWQNDVADLLSFNVRVSDDNQKWVKGG